jgi:hypothetical protein
MSIKNINIFNRRPSKIYPNRDFWFENKPSGNPDTDPNGASVNEIVSEHSSRKKVDLRLSASMDCMNENAAIN